MSKNFVFRCDFGKYENTVKCSFKQADLDIMQEMIDKEKGYGTLYFAISKKGNPYCEVKAPGERQGEEAPRQERQDETPPPADRREPESDVIEDNLPF